MSLPQALFVSVKEGDTLKKNVNIVQSQRNRLENYSNVFNQKRSGGMDIQKVAAEYRLSHWTRVVQKRFKGNFAPDK